MISPSKSQGFDLWCFPRHLDYLKDQLAYWDAEYQKIVDSRFWAVVGQGRFHDREMLRSLRSCWIHMLGEIS